MEINLVFSLFAFQNLGFNLLVVVAVAAPFGIAWKQ